ncbi:MAG: UPF0149 family protein [Pseudomonadales bacterium]|nr:UPF0149 family protein [Pseudomonadales bacterium]
MKNYSELHQALGDLLADHSLAEVHGLLTGLRCSGSRASHSEMTDQISAQFMSSPSGAQRQVIETLVADIDTALRDSDLGFQVMIPADNTPVSERTASLAQWCTGFLAGFGLSGRFQESELGEEVRELLADLSRISVLDEEIPEDDDNEADFTEIVEYVRMSAMLIYTECSAGPVH